MIEGKAYTAFSEIGFGETGRHLSSIKSSHWKQGAIYSTFILNSMHPMTLSSFILFQITFTYIQVKNDKLKTRCRPNGT